MRIIEHIENNWVPYLVALILALCFAVWGVSFAQWANTPQCTTIAEYGGNTWRNPTEGSVTRELVNGTWRDCKVPRYLPNK